MDTDSPPPLHEDPEIAALLDFEPVVRRCKRHDGWTAENQRDFIVGVAETGSPDKAAIRLGRTASGAWKVRKSAGGEGFDAAWDKALALYASRNPRPLTAPNGDGGRWARNRHRAAAAPAPEEEDVDVEKEKRELFHALLRQYWVKARAERRCRLEGRIAGADFYLRQMTCIEVATDLSGYGGRMLAELKRGDVGLVHAVATPLSLYFDYLRRTAWAEAGEPERPELPRFAEMQDGIAGAPSEHYNCERDGVSLEDWRRARGLAEADAAEAQRLWEDKARAASAEWRERLERDDPDALAAALEGPELIVEWEEEEPATPDQEEAGGANPSGEPGPEPEPAP